MLRYEWIWHKSSPTGHLNANRAPLKNHENILVFYKQLPVYNPQGITKKSQPKLRPGRQSGTNYGKCDQPSIQEYENYPRSILYCESVPETVHPTQKPVPLFEYLIQTYTNEGDTVLDNCMGSGTTAVACIAIRRNFIGFELTPEYHKIATERIANVQSALFV